MKQQQQDFTQTISAIHALDKKRRTQLSRLVGKVVSNLSDMDMRLLATDAAKLKFQIDNENFKLLVIGEFNAGKSTFINALLGKEVLPSKAIPATAIINIIKYGEEERALLHFNDIEKDPLDIPLDSLWEYVVIEDGDMESVMETITDNPYSHAEIWFPLKMFKDNNIEIIDSPGLNEDPIREQITLNYARESDAILFIMSAHGYGPAATEMQAIETLTGEKHEDIFFVINKWDTLNREKARNEVKGKALIDLPKLTNRKDDIHFVSALDALDGRVENDKEMEERSGFGKLEDSLHHFLAQEKGESKIRKKSSDFKTLIKRIEQEELPRKIKLLKTPQNILKKKYEMLKKDFEELETDKTSMLRSVERKRNDLKENIKYKVLDFFESVGKQVDDWANDSDLKIEASNLKKTKNNIESHFKENLEDEFRNWKDEVLTPYISERMEDLYRDLELRATEFENRLKEVQFTLNGEHFEFEGELGGPKNALERILSAAGGLVVGGIGLGTIGALFGYKEMLKAMLPQVGAIIGASIVGLPLLPVALVASVILGINAKERLERKIRSKAAENFRESLSVKGKEQAQQIVKEVDKKLIALKKALKSGMERQINEIRERAETALAKHQEGEAKVNEELAKIDEVKRNLSDVTILLNEFLKELSMPQN